MSVAHVILIALAAYVAPGVAFALAFVTVGLGRVDPLARHAPVGFRLMIFPASAALWPLLLRRWRRS